MIVFERWPEVLLPVPFEVVDEVASDEEVGSGRRDHWGGRVAVVEVEVSPRGLARDDGREQKHLLVVIQIILHYRP